MHIEDENGAEGIDPAAWPKYDPANDPNPHPSLANPNMVWDWPDLNDVPKATQADLRAAEVLGRLIKYGYAPDPPPELPEDWQLAFDAVLDVVAEDQRARFSAFTASIAADPLFVLKLNEVNRAMPRTVDRLLQTREAYSADELMSAPPVLDWAIPQLFVQPSVNFLVGPPGSKKDLPRHRSRRLRRHGHPLARPPRQPIPRPLPG